MLNYLSCEYYPEENSMKNLVKILKITIFIAAIVLLVVMLKNGFDSRELKTLILSANPLYIILSILITAFGVVLKGKRLQILAEQFEIKTTLPESIKIQTISIIFAIITPGRAGEFTKIFLLAKDRKDLIPSTTLICIFERLLDFLILTFMSLALCFFSLKDQKIIYLLIFSAFVLTSMMAVLFKIEIFIDKFEKMLPKKVKDILINFAENKDKLFKQMLKISSYSFIIWCLDGLFQYLILMSIGTVTSLAIVIGINAIVSIMSILTILPMGLGTMDISALFLYNNMLALPKEKIVFLLACARLFSISTLLLMILPVLISQKDFVVNLYKDMINKRKSSAS